MAQYKSDIVDVNLNTGNIHRSFLNHSIGQKDDDANRFGIRAFRDGVPQDLSGCSCHAWFTNSQGTTLALTSYGTVDGNEAYVTLPQACYDYDGQFCLAIKIVGGGISSTVRIIDGMVDNIDVGGAVSPTSEIPDYSDILAQYDAMVAATSAANTAIAETFDATKSYPAGKYVINSGALYRLTADHAANVTWANTSKVTAKFGDDLSDLKSATDNIGIIDLTALTWSRGRIGSTGSNATSDYDIRSNYMPVTGGRKIRVIFNNPSRTGVDYYYFNIYEYSSNSSSAFIKYTYVLSNADVKEITLNSSTTYIRINIRAYPYNTTVLSLDEYKYDTLMWTDCAMENVTDEIYSAISKEASTREADDERIKSALFSQFNKTKPNPTIDKAKWINNSGERTTNSTGTMACTHGLWYGNGYRNVITLEGTTDYRMALVYYDETGDITEGTGYLGRSSYNKYMLVIPETAKLFGLNFYKAGEPVLTDDDITAITNALYFYSETDSTFTMRNISADAKAVGDKFTEIDGELEKLQGDVSEKIYSLKSGNITPTGMSGDNNKFIRTYSKALYPITEGDTLVLDGDYELDTAHIYSSNSVSKAANVATLTITDTQELEIPSEYIGMYLGFAIIKTSMSGQDISAYVDDAEQHVRLRNIKGIQEEINELNERVSTLENGYNIPDYYFENGYLDDRIEAINTIGLGIGRNSARFVFVTDYHIEGNARRSPALIEYLMEKTGIKNVMFGGDAYNNSYASKVGAYDKMCLFVNDFKSVNANGNMFYITGNHEYNNADTSHDSSEIPEDVAFNLFNSPITNKIHCLYTSTRPTNAFYIDDDAAKMRIYAIDANHAGQLSPLTIGLIFDSFGDIPEGYSVVLFSHCGIGTITSGVGELTDRMEALMEGAKALNDGATATITLDVGGGYTWNVDFTGKARTFICAITGHRHSDAYCIYDNRFPVILTTCDRGPQSDSSDLMKCGRRLGTIAEQAFDVVQIDTSAREIYMTRIGGSLINAVYDAENDAIVDRSDYDPDSQTIDPGATRYNATEWVLYSPYKDREFNY